MTKHTIQINNEALANNNRTLQSYEVCAEEYAASTSKDPSQQVKDVLQRLVAIAGKGSTILELGSGPGWDADFIESSGVTVRRTDATAAFRDFQSKRGKIIEPLNILTDEFDGPYEGVMALYVLQHIDRTEVAPVLLKAAGSLRTGGALLLSLLEGENEFWEQGKDSGLYHIVLWKENDFIAALNTAGLKVIWKTRHADNEGMWMFFIAQKKS